jgi:diaminohydroxyphosphoribosylaminopyrimidine deaminase/5-amino-6-(5-phosphoribosylamino)uracil reductase
MAHLMDEFYMRLALAVAKDGAGLTEANPNVGCVIVLNGKIIACERTCDSGRPHAEYKAVETAFETFDDIEGCDVYVTLEPCAHISERGPNCSDVLLDIKPARVVIAMQDPDPRTCGNGIKKLEDAGIKVEVGLLGDEASDIIKDFIAKFNAN